MINIGALHHLVELLKNIGFREKESLVYITMLKMGPSFITNIAKITRLPRSSTYNVIIGLLKRGFIKQLKEENHPNQIHQFKYEAIHPNTFLKFLDYRREKMNQHIQNLQEALRKLENRS